MSQKQDGGNFSSGRATYGIGYLRRIKKNSMLIMRHKLINTCHVISLFKIFRSEDVNIDRELNDVP